MCANVPSFKSSFRLGGGWGGADCALIEGGGFKAAPMCVRAFIRGAVCFANWTGIVVEVKRGQLKREKGVQREWRWVGLGGGGLGIYESSSSLLQKKAYGLDKY